MGDRLTGPAICSVAFFLCTALCLPLLAVQE